VSGGGTYWRHAMPGDYAVVGDPIGHSRSPAMHSAAYQHLGLKLIYRAIHIPLEEFEEAVESLIELGYKGVNVTLPLKLNAFDWATDIDEDSRGHEALNTLSLRDRRGTNTDAPGFLDTLDDLGIVAPGPVVLLGAGGTSRALTRALRSRGFEVAIYNRTQEKAEELADAVGGVSVLSQPDIAGAHLILNTTSAGLSGSALDIVWGAALPGAIAYDVIYGHEPTPFLRDAALAGLKTVDGRFMLAAQGARSFEWWLGVPAPRDLMLAAI